MTNTTTVYIISLGQIQIKGSEPFWVYYKDEYAYTYDPPFARFFEEKDYAQMILNSLRKEPDSNDPFSFAFGTDPEQYKVLELDVTYEFNKIA